jgi:hypothetical protein
MPEKAFMGRFRWASNFNTQMAPRFQRFQAFRVERFDHFPHRLVTAPHILGNR